MKTLKQLFMAIYGYYEKLGSCDVDKTGVDAETQQCHFVNRPNRETVHFIWSQAVH
jgi:hypothetical protein